jgi:hypothetical protein
MLRHIGHVEQNGKGSIAIFERFVQNGVVQCAKVFAIKRLGKAFGKLGLRHSALDKLEYPEVADLLDLFQSVSCMGRRRGDARSRHATIAVPCM